MEQHIPSARADGKAALRAARVGWYSVTFVGQWAFVAFIVAFFYVRTFGADFAGWNDKPLIDGHTEGDFWGNLGFAVHSTLAAVMTASGTLQLLPGLRRRWPRFHRISGRVFLVTACVLALSGLGLVWIRGTYLSVVAALAVSLDGVLILAFAAMALRHAVRREIDVHRKWALRLFMVANGVWMLRVGMLFWAITTRGWGMSRNMDGPFDVFWGFGCYLVPLALLELYFWVDERGQRGHRLAYSAVLGAATLAMTVGVFGAVALMWLPHL